VLPNELIREIERLYDDPVRGYHAWSHPQALLALLDEVRGQVHDALAVECAVLLHDAVYDPRRGDNERRSAAVAREMLTGIVPAPTLERAVRLIEATKRHQIPPDVSDDEADDARIFLDLDLSVLGAADAAFDAYEVGVRHEYAHVPDADFRAGRASILAAFLARERLYLSDWGRERFEAKARANLERSLATLRAP
jgi:predicted metal-dependent HD superfamily phosphohydrolase